MTHLAISRVGAPERPVAYLQVGSGVRAAVVEPSCEGAHSLLVYATGVQPRRLRRVSASGGARRVVAEPIAPDDPAFAAAFADCLTYRPGQPPAFEARVIPSLPAGVRLAEVPDGHTFDDALTARRAPLPLVRCACGAQYAFLAMRCSRCRGRDPLATVLSGANMNLFEHFLTSAPAASADELLDACDAFRTAFTSHAKRLAEPPQAPEQADEKARAKATLEDFGGRVSMSGVTSDLVRRLSQATERDSAAIEAAATRFALKERESWRPGCVAGWMPTRAARVRLRRQLARSAATAGEQVRAVGSAQAAAAANLARAAKIFNRVINQSTAEKVARLALTIFSAVKTAGLSLVVKAALWAVRDAADERKLRALDASLTQLHEVLTQAVPIMQSIRGNERGLAGDRRLALASHTERLLAHDYGDAAPTEQVEIARRLALRFGIRPPPRDRRGAGWTPRTHWALAVGTALLGLAVLLYIALAWWWAG